MSRQEKTLLALAVVLVVAAVWVAFGMGRPQSGSSDGYGIPWNILLWQIAQQLAPPLAVVGLASAVGILFLRAARWRKAPALAASEAQDTTRQRGDTSA